MHSKKQATMTMNKSSESMLNSLIYVFKYEIKYLSHIEGIMEFFFICECSQNRKNKYKVQKVMKDIVIEVKIKTVLQKCMPYICYSSKIDEADLNYEDTKILSRINVKFSNAGKQKNDQKQPEIIRLHKKITETSQRYCP